MTDGTENMNVGTYVKQITNADPTSDEAGGNHYYHYLNVAPTGTWTHVILNMHPSHMRGGSGNTDWGVLNHPTALGFTNADGTANGGDDPANTYNYFDTLTRWYIQQDWATSPSPVTIQLKDVKFYNEPNQEDDAQIYNIAATYVASSNRVVVTWDRNKNEDTVNHDVRYSFQDIHQIGWNAATPAPGGIITPPGSGGYNGMVYDTTTLPLAGQTVVYIAIKPENSNLFTEVAVPLNVG